MLCIDIYRSESFAAIKTYYGLYHIVDYDYAIGQKTIKSRIIRHIK